jgi:metal-dependent amidase/aminoacylase/carboxypeptidase family protein
MPVSTDMGNVSHVVPSIHPFIGIETQGAVNHQAGFASACAGPSADQAVIDGALALALTAVEAARDERIRARLLARTAAPT